MIARYRNRSLFYFICAAALTVPALAAFRKLAHFSAYRLNPSLAGYFLILYFAAWLTWVLASLNLARAKGCSKSKAGKLFLVFLIVGFLAPITLLLFPFFVVFSMKDKTQGKRRNH